MKVGLIRLVWNALPMTVVEASSLNGLNDYSTVSI